jgi:hypothetical protein
VEEACLMTKEACLIEDLAREGRFSANLRRAGHECKDMSVRNCHP